MKQFIKHKIFLRTSLLFLIYSSLLNAQYNSTNFVRYNINNGLSNNSINCILQTSDNFLWVATKDGLNRFDGQFFKIFKFDASDSLSLPENYVMSLLESSDSTFYIGTWGRGLCIFDPKKESFKSIDPIGSENNYIQALFEDSKNNIWYGTTTKGLSKFEPKTGKITTYSKSLNSFPSNNITYLLEDKNNILWVGTWDNGLVEFNPKTEKVVNHYIHNNQDETSISDNGVWYLYTDADEYILLSTFKGVDKFDFKTKKSTRLTEELPELNSIKNSTIRLAFKDKKDRLWIGTYDYVGLFLIEETHSEQRYLYFRNEEDDINSLSSSRIRWVYKDRKGNFWVGTEDGLNKLPFKNNFIQYRHLPIRKTSINGRVVSSIFQGKDGTLWVGYGGSGFDKIDLASNNKIHYLNNSSNNSLSNNDVITIYEDRFGIVWIGTMDGGLNRFDKRSNRFTRYLYDKNKKFGIASNWVQQVLETKKGELLVGTNEGLQIFDRGKELFYAFAPSLSDSFVIMPQYVSVNSLFEDSEGNLWIGTWLDGLFRFNPKTKRYSHFFPDIKNNYSVSSSKITAINEDHLGNIWIATHSGGVNKYDKEKNKFYHFTTKNGLPNDVTFGIQEDQKGFIWISTMKGLARFNPVTENFRVFDVNDGLIDDQFNWRASFVGNDGSFYFGGINGFIKFLPDEIKFDSIPPPIAFTSFKIFNREVSLPQSLNATKKIELNYDQNFFSFEFSALDLEPNYKHSFKFMLEGIDPDWVDANGRPEAFYTDIKPGEYKFLVKAANADNIWSNPISMAIVIYPAWWNTWWFRSILFIVVALIAYIIYRAHLKQLLEIERIRLSIASDLHDEIGSNLSSISVDSQLLIGSNTLNENEKELSQFISQTAKETIEAMRDIIWFINPRRDFNISTIFKMKDTASKLLAGISWKFQIDGEIKIDSYNLEVKRNIFLIYKEALNNVVRHSSAKNCDIIVKGIHSTFYMIIKDDGIGFKNESIIENNGLKNMRRRAEKIGAFLKIDSKKDSGTEIIFTYENKKKYFQK